MDEDLNKLIKDKRIVTRERIISSITLASKYCGLPIYQMFSLAGSHASTWSRFCDGASMGFSTYEKVILYAYKHPKPKPPPIKN